ncbi:PQQ-binding-like beta-propeller repeat protein [Aquimarina algicola]|uniref:PQQ-like beta-propeller repeat protein n=1 Tax=Aquimarina algicola TaxID=2589995 RepID=A0A504IZK1_9FLAO|nr:PQQ-binding-like beta-propeller repeat protein [Aquimarina algicola]TPN81188.1 PQQ-like beta-propeller repeat protein [Aquimarina algicola]
MNKFFALCFFIVLTNSVKAQNFQTEGDAIRHTVVASVGGESILYIGELDGSVSSYTMDGEKKWRVKTEDPAVLFEIEAADINGDGNDDLLAANANGNIFCYDSSGELLWKFNSDHKIRFSEVAIVNNKEKVQIFAGGNDYNLYELDSKGKLVSKTKIKGVVRKIQTGNFFGDKEDLFLMTYNHDKFRWDFLGFIDSATKEVIKNAKLKDKRLKNLSKYMITDITVSDINGDNKDDVLFFGDRSMQPQFTALDSNFDVLAVYTGNKKQTQRYAHSQGTFLPSRNEIMFQHGGIIMVLDTQGKVVKEAGSRYGKMVFSDFTYDPVSNQLVAGGTVDGGNVVRFFDLKNDKWWDTKHKKEGRMAEVADNLKKLYEQTLNFKLPSYQKRSDKEWVMSTRENIDPKLDKLNGGNVKFVIQKSPKEGTDRSPLVALLGDIALKKDRRGKYQDTREEIVEMARKMEEQGQPFTMWAGHGNDPFYIQIETLEKILEVAPTTCYGFVYAEMHNTEDPRVIHFINEYLPRLAKAIRKNNRAKLMFRYKNMFWAATSHLPLWKEMFFSGKYNDFLVPASEDTSNRIQDLNLAGRIGMHSGGYINDFAMRLIDDNPTSWRPLSPCGQNTVSPYLRQGVIMASYGARFGIVSTSGFVERPGLNILFALMKSGVIPIVEPENIQSIGSWHLIKDVDEKLVHVVDDHHKVKHYETDDENAVFSVAQMHWAGASIPEHDFSKLALGVRYRWLNYLPQIPKGMVAIAPVESKQKLQTEKIPYFVSNAKVGYIGEKKVSATEFGATIKEKVAQGGQQLNILVNGASWSAIRIDKNHTRLVLVDPNYINPKQHEVIVKFQNRTPKSATDILSGNEIKLAKEIKVNIPAGSMRFIDIAY